MEERKTLIVAFTLEKETPRQRKRTRYRRDGCKESSKRRGQVLQDNFHRGHAENSEEREKSLAKIAAHIQEEDRGVCCVEEKHMPRVIL